MLIKRRALGQRQHRRRDLGSHKTAEITSRAELPQTVEESANSFRNMRLGYAAERTTRWRIAELRRHPSVCGLQRSPNYVDNGCGRPLLSSALEIRRRP